MKQLFPLLFASLFSLQMLHGQCTEDCVWPGDLNANGIANNLDILALGFAMQSTGPQRVNQSTDWEALEADDWSEVLPNLGVNFKHIDADGNGIINEQDRLPILINYNLTNDNFSGLLGNNLEGDDLFAVLVDSVAAPGGSLFFDLHLGTAANPIDDIYGIGFQLKMDTQYVENVIVDYSDSWIGEPTEVLAYDKYSDEIDHAGVAITRVDGNSVNGFGRIARVEIVITDVILGLQLDTTACLPFNISFENVLGINNNESDQFITARGDSMTLKNDSLSTNIIKPISKSENPKLTVFPNPSEGELHVATEDMPFSSMVLYNQVGVVVFQQELSSPLNSFALDLSNFHFPKGIYFLEVGNNKYRTVERVFIE